MTQDPIIIGDTIRHLKRGTRYRVVMRIDADVVNIQDGERYWVSDWYNRKSMHFVIFHGCVSSIGEQILPAEDLLSRHTVVAQVDDATRIAAVEDGSEIIPFFLYESLESPGQCFLRPVSEFTAGRFERLLMQDHPAWFVQSFLPEEQMQLIRDHDAIVRGAPSEGTSLHTQAIRFLGQGETPPGGLRRVMEVIAQAARAEQGGDDRRMHISLSAEERAAVEELSGRQDLSPAAVVRQALRLYQAQIMGEPGPPMGCMGD